MHEAERSRRPNPYVRFAAERGDSVIAHYGVHVIGSYADVPENRSFASNALIVGEEITCVVTDLMLLAESVGLDWAQLLRQAEDCADRDRIEGAMEQFPESDEEPD